MDGWDWPQFLQDIRELCAWSDILNDGWELIVPTETTDSNEGGTYARKRFKSLVKLPPNWLPPVENEDIDCDYEDTSSTKCHSAENGLLLLDQDFHVVFHRSYRVPALCFNAYKPDGTMLTLNEAWLLFSMETVTPMHGVITQMDHPVLFRPFHTLHPCRTGELLGALSQSRNRVLSVLSSLGPAIHLNMDLRYGQLCAAIKTADT